MKHLKFPPEWEDVEQLMFDQNKVIERQLLPGSPEWQKIEANFRLTLQNAVLTKVVRIQNIKLWKVFRNELEEVEKKTGLVNPVRMMYHGTR